MEKLFENLREFLQGLINSQLPIKKRNFLLQKNSLLATNSPLINYAFTCDRVLLDFLTIENVT